MNAWERYVTSLQQQRRLPRTPRVLEKDSQAPKVRRGAEANVDESNALLRRFLRFKAAEYKRAREGAWGDELGLLQRLLRSLTGDEPEQVLTQAKAFVDADPQIRALVLYMIDTAITRLRVRLGQAPIEDSLPGEAPTVFELCRDLLSDIKVSKEQEKQKDGHV